MNHQDLSHRVTNLLPVPVMGYRTEPEFYRYQRLRASRDGMDVVVGDHGHFVGKDVLEAADELIQQEKAQIFEGPPIAPGRHPHHDKDYWLRADTEEGKVWIPLPLKPVFKVGDHVCLYSREKPPHAYLIGTIVEILPQEVAKLEWTEQRIPRKPDAYPFRGLRWVNPQPEPA